MQASTINDIVIIYATSAVNKARIDVDPPQLPFTIEDEHIRKEYMDNAKHGAGQYDMYKDVVQLSMLIHRPPMFDRFYHVIFCDDPAQPVGRVEQGTRTVHVVDKESDLFHVSVTQLRNLCNLNAAGMALGAVPVLAGWKLMTDVWPLLVTKAMAYGVPVPKFWKMDPADRFSNVKGMLEVSNIYTQGVNMTMRKLPALSDALRYFGIGNEYDEPIDIAKLACTQPTAVVEKVERYLVGQYELLTRYYA